MPVIALGCHRHVAQQQAGVDGEVIDALLGLFDQRVLEDFPGQVFGNAVDLFQRLVNRYRANRHRRIAHDPFAGFVDVLAGGQIHHVVAAPADRPGHFFDFFVDAGRQCRVADVGVDFHQEVAAEDHRLDFRMIDVGRDDGTASGNFATNEFRGDFLRNARAEVHALVLARHQLDHLFAVRAGMAQAFDVGLAILVFADGDVFHFRGNDAFFGIVHLRHVRAFFRAARVALEVKAQLGQFRIVQAFLTVGGSRARQFFGVVALQNPCLTNRLQAGADIDGRFRVGVRAGSVIHVDRRVLFLAEHDRGVGQRDLTHRHANVRAGAGYVDLAGIGQWFDRGLVNGGCGRQKFRIGIHGVSFAISVSLQRNPEKCRTNVPHDLSASLRWHYPDQVQRVYLARR